MSHPDCHRQEAKARERAKRIEQEKEQRARREELDAQLKVGVTDTSDNRMLTREGVGSASFTARKCLRECLDGSRGGVM